VRGRVFRGGVGAGQRRGGRLAARRTDGQRAFAPERDGGRRPRRSASVRRRGRTQGKVERHSDLVPVPVRTGFDGRLHRDLPPPFFHLDGAGHLDLSSLLRNGDRCRHRDGRTALVGTGDVAEQAAKRVVPGVSHRFGDDGGRVAPEFDIVDAADDRVRNRFGREPLVERPGGGDSGDSAGDAQSDGCCSIHVTGCRAEEENCSAGRRSQFVRVRRLSPDIDAHDRAAPSSTCP